VDRATKVQVGGTIDPSARDVCRLRSLDGELHHLHAGWRKDNGEAHAAGGATELNRLAGHEIDRRIVA
jgi:hypothetical protein